MDVADLITAAEIGERALSSALSSALNPKPLTLCRDVVL
jgi:hypothetical protein